METQKKTSLKNAYHRPQVKDYGNIAEITKTSTNPGNVSDATQPGNKSF
jgi:hypothetical protein